MLKKKKKTEKKNVSAPFDAYLKKSAFHRIIA